MIVSDANNHVYLDEGIILYSKGDARFIPELKIRYKVEPEEKLIRLYDVPRFLTYQEKEYIYYILLETFCFYPQGARAEYKGFADYTVKENGYSFYEYNQKENPQGILGELIFDIPRPEREPEKIARIRDIYNMLIRNFKEIGTRPMCIAFNGVISDFKTVYMVIQYIFDHHPKIKEKKSEVYIFKRMGLFGGNKRIYIVPRTIIKEKREKEEKEKQEEPRINAKE